MLRVGLTGGIACGKSTVAAMMRELGCAVLEADKIAHELMAPGQPAYEEIVRDFGERILAADKTIDRRQLGEIVFRDAKQLRRLNQIVHPRVIQEQDRRLAEWAAGNAVRVAVVEAALLIEAGYHRKLDRLAVVWCRPEQQRERLRARGLTAEQIEQRIAAQMPLEEKRRLADDAIDCSGPLEHTQSQVQARVTKWMQLAGPMNF
jgi:dephospho-CoA kinase